MNRFMFILYLSASFVHPAFVSPRALALTYESSSLLIHPSSFIPHPFQSPRKVNPEALKKYVGRYGLDAGIIPISTLDVTLENNELWLKPSVVRKRRLIHKSKAVFVFVESERRALDLVDEDRFRLVYESSLPDDRRLQP